MNLKKNFIRNDQINEELRKLKKEFRGWQRYSIYLAEKRDFERLNVIFRQKNKNKFWRFINNSKTLLSPPKIVTVDPKYLLDHYRKLFSESNTYPNIDQLIVS